MNGILGNQNFFPALFIGHGSPLLMVQENPYTGQWKQYYDQFSNLKAIVCISAHWVTRGLGITTNDPQRMIYDFYGFPQDLYDIKLNLSGSMDLAQKIKTILHDYHPVLTDEWGLDHGTWCVINQVNPKTHIPILQISINQDLSFREHFQLAQTLKSLTQENILLLGSGNIVHNLRLTQQITSQEQVHPLAKLFLDNILNYINMQNMEGLLDYLDSGAQEISLSISTQEHFIPLLYVLAQINPNERFEIFNQDFAMSILDMTCVAITK